MLAPKSLSSLILVQNFTRKILRPLSTKIAQKPINESKTSSETVRDSEWKSALPFETIPGPGKLEVLGNFMPGGKFHNKSRFDIAKMLQDQYGDIIRIQGMFRKKDIVYSFNPQHFEKVYRNDGIWPSRRGLETLTHYRLNLRPDIFASSGTLLTSDGEEWGKIRSKVNPIMMQPKTVRIYIPRMDKTTLKFIERLKKIRDPKTDEMPGNFEKELNAWSLEQICLVGLDSELGLIGNESHDTDAEKLIKAISTIISEADLLEFKPSLWKYFETSRYKKVIKAYDDLTDISLKYIQEAIDRYNLNKENDSREENEKSVVERLIKIDKNVAVVMAMEMLFAGVDTTTSTFTGCMLALAKSPEKQEILRKEIKTVFPDRNAPLTEEALKKLPYLRAVLKESLRMFPVVNEHLRTTNVDFVLENYRIPKNTDVLMNGTHMHRNSEYFSEPDKFIPERWLRNQNDSGASTNGCCPATKASNPFVYLPFGFGSRMCVGKRLVDMELEILVTRILQNFNVEYNYNADDVFGLKLIYTPIKELKFKFSDIN